MRGKSSLATRWRLPAILVSVALAPHAFAASVTVPPDTTTCNLEGWSAAS